MKLEPELRAAFMSEAQASQRPASQVMRELMRDFINRQREARDYEDFLKQKVQLARASVRAGRGVSNDEVEQQFAAKRARVAKSA